MTVNKLKAENEFLRSRLEEAEETIRAIRSGAVDAFVVEDSGGHKVYTLVGADRPYRLLVEQMQQGAAMLQADGNIIYCNSRLAEFLKIPHERVIGTPLHDFIVSDDRSIYEDLLSQGRTRSSRGEVRLRRRDGGIIPAYLTFNALPRDCGAEIGVLITDLTAVLQTKEALRTLASHLGLVEQRERHRLATELHDSLAQLLVAGIMKSSQGRQRLSQGSAVDDRFWMELVEIFSQAISYTRTLMGELSPSILHEAGLPSALKWLGENMLRYGLQVEVHVEELNLAIPEDQAVLLFQSARELLWNVVKHADTDRAVLALNTPSADFMLMTIQDQGKGFDPRRTEPPSASRGFGLYSVRERLKAMGGELTLHSSPGQGTCITLKAPIAITSSVQAMSARLALPADRFAQSRLAGPLRILLVDDHAMVRQGLYGILSSYPGLTVIGEASNGEEALRLAEETSPDLILMDVNMPVMDGIAATQRVKELLPTTIVVGLSVNPSSQVVNAMTCAGASGFVSKAMAGEDLYSVIMSITERDKH